MDKRLLEKEYEKSYNELKRHSRFRLNFGVYYTPRF